MRSIWEHVNFMTNLNESRSAWKYLMRGLERGGSRCGNAFVCGARPRININWMTRYPLLCSATLWFSSVGWVAVTRLSHRVAIDQRRAERKLLAEKFYHRTWRDRDDQDGCLNYHWPEKLDLCNYAHPEINCTNAVLAQFSQHLSCF